MYESEIPMKFHNFNRFVLFPIGFISNIITIISFYNMFARTGEKMLIPIIILESVLVLLIAASETGYVTFAAFSYYTTLAYFAIVPVVSVYSSVYTSVKLQNSLAGAVVALPNTTVSSAVTSAIGGLVWFAIIAIYYYRRRFLFIGVDEDEETVAVNTVSKEQMARLSSEFRLEKTEKMSKGEEIAAVESRLSRLDFDDGKSSDRSDDPDVFG